MTIQNKIYYESYERLLSNMIKDDNYFLFYKYFRFPIYNDVHDTIHDQLEECINQLEDQVNEII